MEPFDVTDADFDEVVSAGGMVVVDFWAPWCGPCRAFAPVFDAAAGTHPDVTFVKVDTDAQQGLAARVGIMSVPTLMVFRDGERIFDRAGAMGPAAFDELLAKLSA